MANGHPRPRPERIGHRGAPREFDENTIPGFLRAVERGADAVELDVHLSADGIVVVHHDDDVRGADDRLSPIRSLTLAQIQAARLAQGGIVPTLASVFDALRDAAVVYVELKGAGVGAAAVDVARTHGRRYAFHSFDHDVVHGLRGRWPELHYGVLLDSGHPDALRVAERAPVRDIWAHWGLVDEAMVAAVHAAGKRLIAWTVNDAEVASRLASCGVDGLCGDDVRLFP